MQEQMRAGEITTKRSSKLPQKYFPFLPEKHYFQSSPSHTSQKLLPSWLLYTSQWTIRIRSFLKKHHFMIFVTTCKITVNPGTYTQTCRETHSSFIVNGFPDWLKIHKQTKTLIWKYVACLAFIWYSSGLNNVFQEGKLGKYELVKF